MAGKAKEQKQGGAAAQAVPADVAQIPFEKALDELERIVEQLEEGSLSLEDALSRFARPRPACNASGAARPTSRSWHRSRKKRTRPKRKMTTAVAVSSNGKAPGARVRADFDSWRVAADRHLTRRLARLPNVPPVL